MYRIESPNSESPFVTNDRRVVDAYLGADPQAVAWLVL